MLERSKRICLHCQLNKVEDEQHFMCSCPLYKAYRDDLYSYIVSVNKNFENLSDENKFIWLLSNEDIAIIFKISNYLISCFNLRRNHQL